ncbi:hypothetical protein PUR29_09275 [Methylobacterium ajmalii]|uniref:Uncharacterized protein n=1 Tax=Methylobacterium ajmalii TaxID=2738439 RepID=A0ABU9ZQI5_9HYPH
MKLAEGMKVEGPKLEEMLRVGTAKTVIDTLKKRTATEKDASKIMFDDGSMSNEGLQATSDYKQALMGWLQENPNASSLDREKAAQTIGASFLERLRQPEGPMGATYLDRSGLATPNTFGAAPPPQEAPAGAGGQPTAAPTRGQPAVANPFAGTTVRVPSGLPGAPDEASAPTPPPTAAPAPAAPQAVPQPAPRTPAPAPVAPAASPPAAPAPAGQPTGEAQGWFNGLPPEFRGELERMAATEKKPLQMKVEELYRKGRAAGSIPAPVAPTAPATPAAPTAPPPVNAD